VTFVRGIYHNRADPRIPILAFDNQRWWWMNRNGDWELLPVPPADPQLIVEPSADETSTRECPECGATSSLQRVESFALTMIGGFNAINRPARLVHRTIRPCGHSEWTWPPTEWSVS
jgi:hypothetical protein